MPSIHSLSSKCPFRETELSLLNAFVSDDLSLTSPCVIVHGYKAVGKTEVVKTFLNTLNVHRTIVRCDEFLTNRLLLQHILLSIREDSGCDHRLFPQFYSKGSFLTKFGNSCDTIDNFIINLEIFLESTHYNHPHILVLDKIDQLPDDPYEIYPAFARLRELSKANNIIVMFISSTEIPNEVATMALPQIYFQPYTQDQVTTIIQSKSEECQFPESMGLNGTPAANRFWNLYIQVMVDLYFGYTGSNVTLLKSICIEKWESFIAPVVKNPELVKDFMTVFKSNRHLLQQNETLLNSIVQDFETQEFEPMDTQLNLNNLTLHSKYLLIASYLASFIDPKSDLHFFSNVKYSKFNTRKKFQKKEILTKKDIDTRMLTPSYYDYERFLAIILQIYRNESKHLNQPLNDVTFKPLSELDLTAREHEIANLCLSENSDIGSQIALLVSQGLLLKTQTKDILQPKLRWRCNIGWDEVQSIAKDIEFPLENYLAQ